MTICGLAVTLTFDLLTLSLTCCSFPHYIVFSSVAGPCLWNSLPVASCDRDIPLVQFKRLLKTLWFV